MSKLKPKVYSQTKGNMQNHMNVLQSRLAKMENFEARAEKAERAQRDMAAQLKRFREALEWIVKHDHAIDGTPMFSARKAHEALYGTTTPKAGDRG